MSLTIGALAGRTGASAPTIRYYEEIGLLPPPLRGQSGQRRYDEADVKRLTFIRRCRDFGLPLGEVRALADLMDDPDRSCLEGGPIVRRHLQGVRARLAELEALERGFCAFVRRCDEACVGGPAADCVVLADLAGPAPEPKARTWST
jgi:MerR family copper efflux transcriptional regulator